MLTILVAIVFLLILVIGHEFGHFISAKLSGATVEEFGIGFPPRIAAKKIGETEYSINAIPFGGFVKIHGENAGEDSAHSDNTKRSFTDLSVIKKIIVIASGVVMNLLIAWMAFSAVFVIGLPQRTVIDAVSPNSPAASAGLLPGDQILNFNTPESFTSFMTASAGHKVSFQISRKGETKIITATPLVNPPEGVGHLGVAVVQGGVPREGLISSLADGFRFTMNSAYSIFATLTGLVKGVLFGEWGRLSDVTGPVGVFGVIGQATTLGFTYLLELLGLISVNLAVVNILPFPALDGGRIVMILVQKLNPRIISEKLEGIINVSGLVFLLFLMLVITIRDVSHILGF